MKNLLDFVLLINQDNFLLVMKLLWPTTQKQRKRIGTLLIKHNAHTQNTFIMFNLRATMINCAFLNAKTLSCQI